MTTPIPSNRGSSSNRMVPGVSPAPVIHSGHDQEPDLEFLKYRPTSPFRPFDWRWRRAIWWNDHTGIPDRLKDPMIDRLRVYLKLLRVDQASAVKYWPEFAGAHDLKFSELPEMVKPRVDMEAYILAGESDLDIARICPLSPESVRLYEAIFFETRSRLDASDRIIWHFVDLAGGWVDECDWQTWTRLLGIIGGVHVLDEYMRYREKDPPVVGSMDGMTVEEIEELEGRLAIREFLILAFPKINDWDHNPRRAVDALNSSATTDGCQLSAKIEKPSPISRFG